MLNATQLTNNAVNMVAGLSDLLKGFNISPDNLNNLKAIAASGGNHRLLQENQIMGCDSLLTWFPTAAASSWLHTTAA